MASRLGGRRVNFVNLPIKLLMPAKPTNIHEFALKMIPSALKIEIKRVLESVYGFAWHLYKPRAKIRHLKLLDYNAP